MSLKTRLLCGFRLFLLIKTILEFGDAQHFAGCGCILRLFADSLHRTQSADCRSYRMQDYISERPDYFFRCVLLYTASRLAQPRQSRKVNIRNACILLLWAKYGRFCVLMNGRACIRTVSYWSFGLQQQSTLRIGRTEDRIQMLWLSQIGSLFRRTQKPVRQQGVPHSFRSLADGITGHTRSSSATEFSGLCPPLSSRQEVLFPRGIVLTQTISQKRQATL